MNVALALYLYRLVYVSFIVFASAKTFVEGWPATHGVAAHMGSFVRTLAVAEIVAALGFLWLPIQLWMGAALIAIFIIATGLDLAHGGVPARFAYYGATVAILVFLDLRLRGASV